VSLKLRPPGTALERALHRDYYDLSLHPVGVDSWGGFVFLHLTPDEATARGQRLEAQLGGTFDGMSGRGSVRSDGGTAERRNGGRGAEARSLPVNRGGKVIAHPSPSAVPPFRRSAVHA
jgi:hypothetical protein